MSKHTPGPWVVSIENDGDGPFEVRAPPYIVARVFSDPGHYTPDNARLIAAAPDLLAVLEDALSFLVDHAEEVKDLAASWPENPDGIGAAKTAQVRVERARAAIAKATGK